MKRLLSSMTFLALSLVLVLSLAASCSDDTQPKQTTDRGTTLDKSATGAEASTNDAPKTVDGPIATDGPKTDKSTAKSDLKTQFDGNVTLNCTEIGNCSDTCAAGCPSGLAKYTCMISCTTNCKAKGCSSAQTTFAPLYTCISTTCVLDCVDGPTAKCKTCVQNKCTSQLTACNTQKC